MIPSASEQRDVKRIGWIDDIKIVAGLLMLLDHVLVYGGFAEAWPRYTVTRCVEPLYVFSFGYLIAINPRPFSPRRWLQVALAALIETLIHSHREGCLYFGILTNLVIVMPLTPWIGRLPVVQLKVIVMVSFSLAVFPSSCSQFHIDYGLPLVIGQVAAASLIAKLARRSMTTLAVGWSVSFLLIVVVVAAVALPCDNFWTLMIGQPLALLVICASYWRKRRIHEWGSLKVIARMPLSFYVAHLAVLHCIGIAV